MQRLTSRLDAQKEMGLYRTPPVFDNRRGILLTIGGCSVVNFASNDYLGLSSQESFSSKVGAHFATLGPSSASSRLVSGNSTLINKVEKQLADYFGYEEALILPSGYQANIAIMSALFEATDHLFFDKHVHASTVQGLRLSASVKHGFNHNNMKHLEKRIKLSKSRPSAFVTESLYSMDGDFLKCDELSRLKTEYDALSIVDEAHAFGALGEKGRGVARHCSDIAIGTFGKALGLFGAFILLPAVVKEYLFNFCSPLIYTTALPDAHAASILDVLDFIEQADERRLQLQQKSEYVRSCLKEHGFLAGGEAHIITIMIRDENMASVMMNKLLGCGYYVLAARYPTVPLGKAILRISLTADHEKRHIDDFVTALVDCWKVCSHSKSLNSK